MEYTVVYEVGPNNLSAYVPTLPVVAVTGGSLEELAAHARAAIAFHVYGSPRAVDAVHVKLVQEYGADRGSGGTDGTTLEVKEY